MNVGEKASGVERNHVSSTEWQFAFLGCPVVGNDSSIS